MPRVTKSSQIASLQESINTLMDMNRALSSRNQDLENYIMGADQRCHEAVMSKVRIIHELMMHPDLHQIAN